MTALVIDDDPSMRTLLFHQMKKLGVVCLLAHSVESGIKVALENIHTIRVILLDICMPEESGIGFLKKRKEIESLALIPVIMVTCLGDKASIIEALKNGAEDYLIKPFHLDLMRNALIKLGLPIEGSQ